MKQKVLHEIPGERRPSIRRGGSEVAPAFGLRVLAAPLSHSRDTSSFAPRSPVPRSQSAGETGRTPNAGASHQPLSQRARPPASVHPGIPRRAKKNLVVPVVTGLILLTGAGLLVACNRNPLYAPARREWKAQALLEIARRAADAAWVAAEIESLKAKAAQDPSDDSTWFSDRLILMKNGEWLIYASKCSKEDRRIHDIFLGRASDGKWYYSTYHFCVRMLELRVEEQPDDLSHFISAHFLREFDGRSDECLNLTWPPKQE